MNEPTMKDLNDMRDTFAMFAMVGMLSATAEGRPWPGARDTARVAYEFADAMMAEGEK